MSAKPTSSLKRLLNVLDCFSEHHSLWSVEDIALKLDISIPTAYRYMKLLVDAGLLQHHGESNYTFGSRILTMDYVVRQTDPVLKASIPIMKELVSKTGFDCVLSSSYGDQILDTYRIESSDKPLLSYGRGRPRPIFKGGAPKIIIAYLPTRQLRKLFNNHQPVLAENNIPDDWGAFRDYYAKIRNQGYYFSHGELEPHLAGLAVPINKTESSGAWAAISLVTELTRFELIDLPKMTNVLSDAAKTISSKLTNI